MSRHTAEPWEVKTDETGRISIVAGWQEVAFVTPHGAHRADEDAANAAVLGASLDMAEALLSFVDDDNTLTRQDRRAKAYAALAKAGL